jgi:hypothetical protein
MRLGAWERVAAAQSAGPVFLFLCVWVLVYPFAEVACNNRTARAALAWHWAVRPWGPRETSPCPQAESEMAVLKQELEATRALSLAMGAGLATFAASSG